MPLRLLLTIFLVLAGCSTVNTHRSEVHEGMTRADVIALLGTPDSSTGGFGDKTEGLYWESGKDFWTFEWHDNFCVWLQEGIVRQWGPGHCRHN